MNMGAVVARTLIAGAVMATSTVGPAHAATGVTLQLQAAQYQQHSWWCVSASAAIALAQEGVNVEQSTLAADFHTVDHVGVYGDIRPQLDALAAPGYRFEYRPDTTSPLRLQSVLEYDVVTLRQPVMVAVDGAKLSWNSAYAGHGPQWHVEVAYGYDESTQTVTLWEVWGPTGGTHTIPLDQLAADLNPSAGVIEVIRS